MSRVMKGFRLTENSSTRNEDQPDMTRRQWMKRLAGTTGAGLALPAVASAGAALAKSGPEAPASEPAPQVSPWKPIFFDAHQGETVAALAERTLPGSSRAQVPQFLDLALAADSQENQKKVLAALAAFEGASIDRFGHPFTALSAVQQSELLVSASTAESGHKPGVRGEDWVATAVKAAEPPRDTLRDHFNYFKRRVREAYYSSEFGMQELGWTGEMYYDSYPDCRRSREGK